MLALLAASPSRAKEAEKPSCEDTLALCDNYVTALEQENEQLKSDLEDQDKELADLVSKQQVYPWYFYFALGSAAALTARELTR